MCLNQILFVEICVNQITQYIAQFLDVMTVLLSGFELE